MSKKSNPPLSAAQYEIMAVVWDRGETTINDVLEAVNKSRKKALRRTTIQVQMSRLEHKGWLTHRVVGRTYFYKAARSKDKARADMAAELTRRVFDGSCVDLIKCLFDKDKISKEEIHRIRKLLD